MKKSIKRLPKRTQEELTGLLDLGCKNIENCQMVILFGSYTRGNYVLWDSNIESRYNKDFSISQEQLEYLISRVDILRDVTERLCKEKIAEYDTMTESVDTIVWKQVICRYKMPIIITIDEGEILYMIFFISTMLGLRALMGLERVICYRFRLNIGQYIA